MSNDIQGSFIKIPGETVLARIETLLPHIDAHNPKAIDYYWKEVVHKCKKEAAEQKEPNWFMKFFQRNIEKNTYLESAETMRAHCVLHKHDSFYGDGDGNAWWYLLHEKDYCICDNSIYKLRRLRNLILDMPNKTHDMFLSESDNSHIRGVQNHLEKLEAYIKQPIV